MNYLKILFVLGGASQTIGGHTLSAITLANYTYERGYDVGMLLSPAPSCIFDLENCKFRLHYKKALYGKGALLNRPSDIFQIVKNYHYNVIIAMDWYAAMYSGLAAVWGKVPVVQVIAGGKGPPSSPLNLPGIILFSEELMENIPAKFGLGSEKLILSRGRIDFNAYKDPTNGQGSALSNNHKQGVPRVLSVSRLNKAKGPSILALFDQVEQYASEKPIECIVIGEGDAKPALILRAEKIEKESSSRAKIKFLGGFRVNQSHLQQADLVVGQGRTVLEAIASGVPAAVCGENGYYGLLTTTSLPALATTNLTGRQYNPFSTLTEDLERLIEFREQEESSVYELAHSMYDASLGVEAVEKAIRLIMDYFARVKINRWTLASVWLESWRIGIITLLRKKIMKNNP